MPLSQLNKLNSINGDKTEKNKIIKDVEAPEEDRDVINKKWGVDRWG